MQLVAITVLFAAGVFQHEIIERVVGMDASIYRGILAGEIPDDIGLRWNHWAFNASRTGGIALLWLAALLTAISGFDYFFKARPYLRDDAS